MRSGTAGEPAEPGVALGTPRAWKQPRRDSLWMERPGRGGDGGGQEESGWGRAGVTTHRESNPSFALGRPCIIRLQDNPCCLS